MGTKNRRWVETEVSISKIYVFKCAIGIGSKQVVYVLAAP